jgi:hypothetical protein
MPASLRTKLGEPAADGLMNMFADAHILATASFERRLGEELAKLRCEMVAGHANLRADLLKWSFLFWIGQLAAVVGLLSLIR